MSEEEKPPWGDEAVFGKKPEGREYGEASLNGEQKGYDSLDELASELASGKRSLGWVWTPESEYLVAPEELEELEGALVKRQRLFAREKLEGSRKSLIIFGVLTGWAGLAGFSQGGLAAVAKSQSFILAAILWTIFGLWPWWSARQGLRAAVGVGDAREARFDLWLEKQRVRVVFGLLGLVVLVGLIQIRVDVDFQAAGGLFGKIKGVFFWMAGASVEKAGMMKEAVREGEKWRVMTGAFLHGMPLHLMLNASALWYFGKRVEVLARWPHLLGVMLFSIFVAGWTTVYLLPGQNSVGISGGVAGLLGFLLVFETLHRKLVPRSARHRLFATLAAMVVIGAVGFRYVDNAAHAGGLLGGMIYAGLIFPKSKASSRPSLLRRDVVMGIGAGFFLLFFALMAVTKMLSL